MDSTDELKKIAQLRAALNQLRAHAAAFKKFFDETKDISIEGMFLLPEMLNNFFKDAYADGTMISCAETYGIQAALIEQ